MSEATSNAGDLHLLTSKPARRFIQGVKHALPPGWETSDLWSKGEGEDARNIVDISAPDGRCWRVTQHPDILSGSPCSPYEAGWRTVVGVIDCAGGEGEVSGD